MATQISLPFGTTNTTDDVILVTVNIAGGANEAHTFDIPFEAAPQVLSGVAEASADATVTAVPTATGVTVYHWGAGGATDCHVMLRGKLKSTSDKIS